MFMRAPNTHGVRYRDLIVEPGAIVEVWDCDVACLEVEDWEIVDAGDSLFDPIEEGEDL